MSRSNLSFTIHKVPDNSYLLHNNGYYDNHVCYSGGVAGWLVQVGNTILRS